MTDRTLSLFSLDVVRDARDLYGSPKEVHIDCLPRFPEAVVIGMRRELEVLERAGIPAFADGRRVWTPRGSFFIELSGRPSRHLTSVVDFEDRVRHAVVRMETESGYSFNHTFLIRYLRQEDSNYAETD